MIQLHRRMQTPNNMKQFLPLVAGFVLISREYILEHLTMTASET